jgi:polyisoprenoid-binding protein YceI
MRNKTFKIGFAVGVIAGFIALLGAAFVWFSGGTAQASVAVTAPALQATGTGKLFHIVAEKSEVRFLIDEMLIGQPKTVVGKTNQVAGEMIVDFQNPAKSQLGAIRINVRTLTTDNEFRNRALRGQILQSTKPEFEFATFVPTELKGLPAAFAIGQSYSFQIVGKLTLRDVTRDVTFDATVKPISSEQLTGTAKTSVNYKDFRLSIPEAPGVADIAENVRLEIDFTAIPASAHE